MKNRRIIDLEGVSDRLIINRIFVPFDQQILKLDSSVRGNLFLL